MKRIKMKTLHQEIPANAWARIERESGGPDDPEYDMQRSHEMNEGRRTYFILAAAAVVAALIVVGGAVRSSSVDDAEASATAQVDGSAFCQFSVDLAGFPPFERIDTAQALTVSQEGLKDLGQVAVQQSRVGDQTVEVFAGAFDRLTFEEATMPPDNGDAPSLTGSSGVVVGYEPRSDSCQSWGVSATGPQPRKNLDRVREVVRALEGN